MIRAAIYLRVSTDQQAQEGDSIPAQLDALTRYVNERPDMVLAGEYIDGGVSGTKADREELTRLTADIVAGKIDRVLVTKLDRLYRSVRHYVNTMEVWEAHGVGWTAIWEPMYDTTTPQGRLVVNQMMSIAQFEAEHTSQRIRAVMEYKIAQGEAVTGKCPIGYRIQDKHLVIEPEGADLIRELYRLYHTCGSLNEVVRYTIATGRPISKQAVKHILHNRKYIGEHRGNAHYCPPIIDRALFDDVQRKLAINVSGSARYVNIFRGLLICSECGCRMAGVHDTTKIHGGMPYAYYRCPGYYTRRPRSCSCRRTIAETTVESYLISDLMQVAREVRAEQVQGQQAHADHTREMAALDRRIARLKDLYLAEEITMDEYKRDKADIEAQKAALTVPEPPKDSGTADAILAIGDLRALVESLTPEERRFLWRGLVREIIVYPDRRMELHLS